MSSFEQFKRSKISERSNKSNSRLSFKSFENQPLNLENVSFSTNEIVFQLQEGQQMLVNQQLKVTNRTGSRLYFRIKSNNPDYYQIRPTQDILEINAILTILFRLNIRKIISSSPERNSSQRTILNRFVENNAFQFAWGEITEQNIRNNETPKISKCQIFKVRLEEPPILAHLLSSKKNTSLSMNGQHKQEQIQSANQLKMYSVDKENTELDETEHSSLLTIPIIAGVAFLSFVIGYFSA